MIQFEHLFDKSERLESHSENQAEDLTKTFNR
jgi:hypothetical protein